MNKTLKISLIALMACLALLGVGSWYAASFVNPTQLTKLLSSTVKESTGRDLKISGPVSLSIFPLISVQAEQVALSNASWGRDPEFLALKKIQLDIRLLPLLKGDVEISRISVMGLDAYLQLNQAGDGNWNLTPPTLSSTTSQNTTQNTSQASSDGSSSNPFVSFKTLDIQDVLVHYQDEKQAAKVISLPKVSIGGSDGKTTINIDAQYANYKLNLSGETGSLRTAYFNWDQKPVNIDLNLALTLNGKTLTINGEIDKKPQVLPQFNINLNSKSFDVAPLVGSAAVASAGGKGAPKVAHQSQGKYFFSDDALPFYLLPLADGRVNINIAELGVPDQAPFTNFKTTLQFKKDRIDANDLSFNVGKGSAQGQVSVSQFNATPKVSLKGFAKGFSLEQIVATSDPSAKVSGGATQFAINLQGGGLSLHQILSRANGAVQISVGQSKLDSGFLNKGGDFLITVFDTVNPLYKKSNQTVMECAVAYLPISSGIVNIQNSVGIETDRLNVVLSGSINLSDESLNININPSEKSGLTTGVDLGGLVKIEGTLQNPQAGVNKAGVVTSAVSIGLGFLTGGISIAAENAKSLVTKSQPCKTALHSWSEIYPASN